MVNGQTPEGGPPRALHHMVYRNNHPIKSKMGKYNLHDITASTSLLFSIFLLTMVKLSKPNILGQIRKTLSLEEVRKSSKNREFCPKFYKKCYEIPLFLCKM